MPEKKEKKKFAETKFGIFLKEKAPKLLDKVADFLPDKGALGIIKNLIDRDPDVREEVNNMSIQDRLSFDRELIAFEMEMYKIDAADRDSARNREIEYVKSTGHVDWMMYATGITALLAFIFIIYAAVYKPEVFNKNPVLHQITGMIEGVALTMFAFYFGSSKGSRDKSKTIADNL